MVETQHEVLNLWFDNRQHQITSMGVEAHGIDELGNWCHPRLVGDLCKC